MTPTAIIEAKLREFAERPEFSHAIPDVAKAIASALADARRADVETVRVFIGRGCSLCDQRVSNRHGDCDQCGEALAALSRLAGET
jgi:hypothetical protein